MRKASIAIGTIAAATAGSAVFGGVALAGCHDGCHSHHHGHHHGSYHHTRGGDAFGGEATNNCLNVGVPILSGDAIGGSGKAQGAGCYASANASGGDAY
jgi:hypothetical protein